jgi:hypothetical protein
MKSTQVFVQMSTLTSIDEVHPVTGRSVIKDETLEQIQARYPGAEIMTWDRFIERKEKALCADPVEITKEKWWYALEVLPPTKWYNDREWNSFLLSELLSGRVGHWYVRHAGRYWEVTQRDDIDRAMLHQMVLDAEKASTP